MSSSPTTDDYKRKKIEKEALELKKFIREHPDFPKPGVLFRDIFPILQCAKSFQLMMDLLIRHIRLECTEVEAIFGLESRGFLLGPLLAFQLRLPFLPIRKAGKLPGNTKKQTYQLEYGEDCLEVQSDYAANHKKCIIVDDLLATGGTLFAANRLLDECKCKVLESIVVMELTKLNGRNRLEKSGYKVFSLVKYDN